MGNQSAQERLMAHYPIHFIRTTDEEGEACFFLIRASQNNYQKLMASKHLRSIDISDYGEVLASGFGEPTEALRREIKETYGVDLPE
jgi:hypothetical protein